MLGDIPLQTGLYRFECACDMGSHLRKKDAGMVDKQGVCPNVPPGRAKWAFSARMVLGQCRRDNALHADHVGSALLVAWGASVPTIPTSHAWRVATWTSAQLPQYWQVDGAVWACRGHP